MFSVNKTVWIFSRLVDCGKAGNLTQTIGRSGNSTKTITECFLTCVEVVQWFKNLWIDSKIRSLYGFQLFDKSKSDRHWGQHCLTGSHFWRHSTWNLWPQDVLKIMVPCLKGSKQIVQFSFFSSSVAGVPVNLIFTLFLPLIMQSEELIYRGTLASCLPGFLIRPRFRIST